ncbi:MAG: hypothetical protein CEE43_03550 [Promethearchaeota archaeon Loki_b32]|nr:MAG: hypothetical protein CEE43_03550 [Candidatus Lokiarchaeota archaeon Loki_b32]
MIEVLNKNNKRIGFIEGEKCFNKKHKLIGYLEGNEVKNKEGNVFFKLDKHNAVFMGNDQVGFIYNSVIYFREQPVFEVLKEKKEIYTSDQKKVLRLIGKHEKVDDIDFFAIATLFLKSNWMDIVFQHY